MKVIASVQQLERLIQARWSDGISFRRHAQALYDSLSDAPAPKDRCPYAPPGQQAMCYIVPPPTDAPAPAEEWVLQGAGELTGLRVPMLRKAVPDALESAAARVEALERRLREILAIVNTPPQDVVDRTIADMIRGLFPPDAPEPAAETPDVETGPVAAEYTTTIQDGPAPRVNPHDVVYWGRERAEALAREAAKGVGRGVVEKPHAAPASAESAVHRLLIFLSGVQAILRGHGSTQVAEDLGRARKQAEEELKGMSQ